MKGKLKIKLKDKSFNESLIIIRDARVGGLNYVEIAERLGLDKEQVFLAHLQLMNKKLLGWKPEYFDKEIEVIDPETKIITTRIEKEVVATWFVPTQPEKKHRMRFNFKLNKKRGQTKKEVARDGKPKT